VARSPSRLWRCALVRNPFGSALSMRDGGGNELYDEMASSGMGVEAIEGRYCLAVVCVGGELEG
jgi:hypothetical protein